MVHLLFGEQHLEEYVAATAKAAVLLSPGGQVRFHVVYVPTTASTDYESVAMQLTEQGPEALRDAVIDGNELYRFESARMEAT